MKKSTLRPSPTAILNPRCDPTFKAIFTQGTKESNLALKSFLTALLGKEIESFTLQPNEEAVDSPQDMQMSFDVNVVFNDGEKADIEMQGRQYDYDYGSRSEIQAAR
nr:Rpn family recombination-promoting nuclease/putative transposase [Treponema sp.]